MPTQPPRKPDVSVTPQPKTPSEWSPRPIPAPGPGRSTADPKTPTKRELAARMQRASAVADATRVARPHPPSPAGPSLAQQARMAVDPLAYAAHLEQLEAERQRGTVAGKVRRRAERAALVARGRAVASELPAAEEQVLRTASDRLAQYSSDIELARLSRDMYRADGTGVPPLGWTRLSANVREFPELLPPGLRDPRLWRDDASGFVAGLYQEDHELGGRIVLAYRGTADKPGWVTDLKQGLGLPTRQYRETYDVATAVAKAYGPDVLVTGHSLGAGEASLASAVTGLRGATFNPSGLHPATAAAYRTKPSAADALLNAYHVPGEALSAVQSVAGRSILDPHADDVKRWVVTHLPDEDGRTLTAADLAPTKVPPAVGRYIALPDPGGPRPENAGALLSIPGSPLVGVPGQVVRGLGGVMTSAVRHTAIFPIHSMELQKERDRTTITRATTSGVGEP